MISNRDATMINPRANPGASAPDPKAWASTLYKMARNNKHAVVSEDQTRKTFMKTDSSVFALSKEKRSFLTQVEVRLAVEAAQREETRSVSWKPVEAIICNVFATGYCALTEDIKILSSRSWVT